MTIYYLTKEKDMLDYICWEHYGFTSGVVEVVLEKNPGLAEYGSFLPAGLKITLPVREKPLQKSTLKVWE
ncbi:tail protein X [Wolbachia endosymbiont of Diaphorina citri]|jgi:P2-like prophage tail protein X|uniref:tail protein X n=1 Tax=unclassified Wolbachia TaxID=2640676 RepID=UPI00155E07FC|nr:MULTISPECIES: tail protein X [unclassified Wolbachia]MDV6249247.1 tail protein X [Wolbachia endosymbiont of Zaprionus taronus]QJT94819.1 tail protein X [Wolbachia endosymbiont of Diaphorina citri]QJT96133.1 tail protein X [Wolbachia endosymbiont of Diaphorina citri]QJT97500.1 tail protein X [Wolbachia endosymbiont of Diaphorina citri]QLK11984.1 phage tail protein [Wolbachia endosymbiont of Diaphorina citri]